MSVENFNTTDAAPSPPRLIIHPKTEQKPNSINSKQSSGNENDKTLSDDLENESKSKKNDKLPEEKTKEQKDKSNILHNKKSPKGRKIPFKIPKSTNGVIKIVNIENSSGVHVGNTYNYTYNSEGPKTTNCQDEVERSYEINRLLDSRTILNQEHIDVISRHTGKSWRDIGIRLGYSKGELDNFYEDNKEHGLKEVSYQMLLDWIQMKADEAILGELMSIMWHLGEKLLVREISKISSIR